MFAATLLPSRSASAFPANVVEDESVAEGAAGTTVETPTVRLDDGVSPLLDEIALNVRLQSSGDQAVS